MAVEAFYEISYSLFVFFTKDTVQSGRYLHTLRRNMLPQLHGHFLPSVSRCLYQTTLQSFQSKPAVVYCCRAHPNSSRSFDLVFLELSRFQCYYGLVHHVGSPPVIGIRTVGITNPTLSAVGNPNNPAYFPDYYLPYTSSMTFFERLHNSLYYVWYRYVWCSNACSRQLYLYAHKRACTRAHATLRDFKPVFQSLTFNAI